MARYFIRLTGSIFSLFCLLKLNVGPQGRATKPRKDNQRKQEERRREQGGERKEGHWFILFEMKACCNIDKL